MVNQNSSSKDLIQRLKKNRRVVVGIVAVLIAFGGFHYTQWQQGQREIFLFNGATFKEHELSRIEMAFAKSGLNDYRVTEGKIGVAYQDRKDYLAAIAKHKAEPGAIKANDDAKNPLFPNRDQRLQAAIEAKRQKINESLSKLKFVAESWVDYDESKSGGLSTGIQRSIVVAVAKKTGFLNQLEIATIRDVCRHSVAGATNEDIVITDTRAGISFNSDAILNKDQLQGSLARQVKINDLRQRIDQALGHLQGIEVAVSSMKPRVVELAKRNVTQKPATPQVGANQPVQVHNEMPDSPVEQQLEDRFRIRVLVSRETMANENVGFENVKDVKSARSLFEKTRLQILPKVDDVVSHWDSAGHHEIEVVPDQDLFERRTTKASAAASIDWPALLSWVQVNWLALVLITAAVTCILILLRRNPNGKSQFRSNATANHNQVTPQSAPSPQAATIPIATARQPVNRARTEEPPQDKQLRQEISEFIRNHPDQATEILQDWMKDAA